MESTPLSHEELRSELETLRRDNQRMREELDRLQVGEPGPTPVDTVPGATESDGIYRRIFENVQDVYFIHAPDGIIQDISPSISRFTGHQREDLIGQPQEVLFARRERGHALLRTVLEEGEVLDYEGVLKANRGSRHIHVSINAHVVTSADGAIIAVEGAMRDVTERKRAELAVKKSEANYRNLFDHANDAILIIDPDTELILEANTRACTLYGVPYSELIGVPLTRFSEHPDHGKRQIAQAMATMEFRNHETTHINSRGERLDLLVSGSLIEYEGSHAILSINRDISEIKKAERALREHQEYLTNLLNSVADPLVVKDATHTWTMVNDAFCALIGKDRSRLLGRSDADLFPEHEVGLYREQDELVLRTGSESVSEQRLYDNRGDLRVLTTKRMRYTNTAGECFVVSISRDITDIKRAQEELEKLNVELEWRVYERTNELLLTIDKLEAEIEQRKRSEFIRSATYRISELAHSVRGMQDLYHAIHAVIAELMPAKNFLIALYHADSGMISFPYFVDEVEAPPLPRRAGQGLIEYVLRGGKALLATPDLLVDLIAAGEIDDSGAALTNWLGVPLKTRNRTIGVLAIQARDGDTQYGETEKHILTFVSEQIAIAIERKRAEEDLVGAKAAAERASRVKTTLLMNLSHEFRTPMNSILGFSDILKSELQEPIQKEMAQTVHHSGFRLMKTLNAIVELAQIESGTVQLAVIDLDVNERMQHIVDSFRTAADDKELSLRASFNADIRLNIDLKVFDQIVGNLVDNAIRFTNQGAVDVQLDEERDDAGRWAVIRVRDTGIGIAPENLEVIFHEFRQLSEGIKRTHEGNGLGLTLSRKWVELLDGSITVKSQEGHGSEFMVRLPIELNVVRGGNSDFEEAFQEFVDRTRLRAERTGHVEDVLVVEDNEYNLELMKLYLRSSFRVECASDGERAIMMASHKRYALILMDINLGTGIDGLEAARHIKAMPGYEQVPIVAVTGYASDFNVESLLAQGCTHYLAKPFEKLDLLSLIDRIMTETA